MKKILLSTILVLLPIGASAHPHIQEQVQGMLCEIFARHQITLPWCIPQEPQEPEPTPIPTPSPTPTPTPTPAPLNHLLVTEVYYDVGSNHGTESSNEWVEIYNATGAAVDLTGWKISDATSTDVFPDSPILADNSFAVITNSDSTEPFWSWPAETLVILLGSPIGNGLGNSGDALYLKKADDTIVDSVSWGTNIDVFEPSAPDVPEGHSLTRDPQTTDTGTAADWIDLDSPTPGS
jgi:hypothetical protein